jgi:hypothetical protein
MSRVVLSAVLAAESGGEAASFFTSEKRALFIAER